MGNELDEHGPTAYEHWWEQGVHKTVSGPRTWCPTRVLPAQGCAAGQEGPSWETGCKASSGLGAPPPSILPWGQWLVVWFYRGTPALAPASFHSITGSDR